jgi:hypothetical protein
VAVEGGFDGVGDSCPNPPACQGMVRRMANEAKCNGRIRFFRGNHCKKEGGSAEYIS